MGCWMELLPVDLPVVASPRCALVLDRVLLDVREASANDWACNPEPCPGRPCKRPGLGAVMILTVSGNTHCSLSSSGGDC